MSVPADSLFVDASGWSAYLDEQDPNHATAVKAIQRSEDRLFTSDYVLSELSRSAHPRVDRRRLSSLIWRFCGRQESKLLKVSEDEELVAWHVYRKYSGSHPSFADCTSLVLLNRHGINACLSFNNWLPKTVDEVNAFLRNLLLNGDANMSSG